MFNCYTCARQSILERGLSLYSVTMAVTPVAVSDSAAPLCWVEALIITQSVTFFVSYEVNVDVVN
jgi:hypothetical protein